MICAVIMAGGIGRRLWPISTEEKPKQFLSLLGERTMIQMTVDRLQGIVPLERIFVVTGRDYEKYVKEQLPNISHRNIILEPYGMNTAPCIALAAMHINNIFDNTTMVVLPADHYVDDVGKFQKIISTAGNFIEKNEKKIITLGMKPDRPECGYGYIKYRGIIEQKDGFEIMGVEKFVEKPSMEKALEYLEEGNYLWNGGMFIWKTGWIMELIEKYLPKTFHMISHMKLLRGDVYEDQLYEKYKFAEKTSIDYGIMEKTKDICVIPSEFGWDDIGSLKAISKYDKK